MIMHIKLIKAANHRISQQSAKFKNTKITQYQTVNIKFDFAKMQTSHRVLRSHTRSKLPPSKLFPSQCSTQCFDDLTQPQQQSQITKPTKSTKLAKNKQPKSQTQLTKQAQARHALMQLEESHCPEILIGREKEEEVVREFVRRGVENGGSTSTLYVSGVPGIGKTASVMKVVKEMTKTRKMKAMAYYVNAMQLKTPEGVYKYLLFNMFGVVKRRGMDVLGELNKHMMEEGNPRQPMRIVVLDEMDFLITKDQQVLYNIFQWTQHKTSKLIVIAIANTMDVPQKLKAKVLSRMGDSRLVFRQYTAQQLQRIITNRLQSFPIFPQSTIRFACRKLCTSTTDIRKILSILTQSILLFLSDPSSALLSIDHIKQAFEQISPTSLSTQYLQSLSLFEQRCLVMIMLECKDKATVGVEDIARRVEASDKRYWEQRVTMRVMRVVVAMAEMGLLEIRGVEKGVDRVRVKPNVKVEEVREGIVYEELARWRDLLG